MRLNYAPCFRNIGPCRYVFTRIFGSIRVMYRERLPDKVPEQRLRLERTAQKQMMVGEVAETHSGLLQNSKSWQSSSTKKDSLALLR
jgi:hypothetical protein